MYTFSHSHVPMQWFLFRETYMTRIDKTEDKVNKVFREYQDNWSKYGESKEKGPTTVKVWVGCSRLCDHISFSVSFSLYPSFFFLSLPPSLPPCLPLIYPPPPPSSLPLPFFSLPPPSCRRW